MKKMPIGVYKNRGSNTYYYSSSLNIDPNITYRNRIFGFNSIADAYKAKKEYERKVRAAIDKNKINGLIKRVKSSNKKEILRHFLSGYLDYEITDLFNESSINRLRNKINRLDISISYKNKAISVIKELVLLAYDKSYIDEVSKDSVINNLTYFKYPKREKINYKFRNEILSKIDENNLDYVSKNIDEVLESIV